MKIIGYTAYLTDEEIRKCKSYGMDECMQKPTPESILFQLIIKELDSKIKIK